MMEPNKPRPTAVCAKCKHCSKSALRTYEEGDAWNALCAIPKTVTDHVTGAKSVTHEPLHMKNPLGGCREFVARKR